MRAVLALLVAGCGAKDPKPDREPEPLGPPWFEDVTESSGVDTTHAPRGALDGTAIAVLDVDRDGVLDLVLSPGRMPIEAWRGLGELSFERASFGLPGDLVATALGVADLDRDGDPDLVVALEEGMALYRNDAGTLVDASSEAGLDRVAVAEVVHVLPADLDFDGRLDLYLSSQAGPNTALWQQEDGSFLEESTGVAGDEPSWTASWLDLDREGGFGLFTTTDTQENDYGQEPESTLPSEVGDRLYVSSPTAAWQEVAGPKGLGHERSSMGALPLDLEEDGWPDLLISDFGRNDLMLGDGDGFEPATSVWGLDVAMHELGPCSEGGIGRDKCLTVSWAAHSLDADGDGRRDVVVFNGGIEPDELGNQPSEAWLRRDDGFVAANLGVDPMSARGAVLADLDADGDLDAVVATWFDRVHILDGLGAHALPVRLTGVASPIDGEGAWARCTWDDGTRDTVWFGAGGVPMSSPLPQAWLFPAGRSEGTLEVHWPSGTTQQVAFSAAAPEVQVTETSP